MDSETNTNLIIAISSPSGAGKTSICKKLLEIDSKLKISISDTTRIARQNEVNGKDYNFLTKEEFQTKIMQNKYVEYAEVFGNFYGSPKENVVNILESGNDVLFDIDWQGVKQLKDSSLKNILSIFIMPPNKNEIQKRLNTRAIDSGDNKESIKQRMALYETEISHQNEYKYIVTNDVFEICLYEILKIIDDERKKLIKST